ncbi:putative secondary metabolism biosynthetic enzyme [Alternaria hordeiaustralica]|uniref:putative secondary metabolism biosynthetic enzyme n=1 Tax=Alternaria hordeiaustralica TaxID=1187925 RepID=UPI0020C20F57|nr:putative secondary metabolism biosynthetic enzyme [Alternaria hordeiaustralica]KAI4682724.1 putative secondary metabolism biosynthetic enzyme [Alternaria hordeiaustralica]
MGEAYDPTTIFSPSRELAARIGNQKPRQKTNPSSSFYRNLEDALEVKKKSHTFYSIQQNLWQAAESTVDFISNDILSFGTSGILKTEYLKELSRYDQRNPGAPGSRLAEGNYAYIEETEQHIAKFHGAKTALLLASGFEANVAIWTSIPRPGDVILCDTLVHASTHEGIDQSLAGERESFAHNDIEDFRRILTWIIESNPLIQRGARSVLVAVESVYSMDGDVCPLQELVDAARELAPSGSVQFVVDEAHSNGIYGPQGKGLVCALGLEKEVAIVMHSYGKALSSRGATVLGNETIKSTLLNFARTIIFTTAPSFASVALIRTGYRLLESEVGRQAQAQVHDLVDLFLQSIISHPLWESAERTGLLAIPLLKDWEGSPTATSHIITIRTRQSYTYWLYFHLLLDGYCVFPVEHPVVAKGESRLKVTFHAGNTEEQVSGMVRSVFAWIQEMMEIEGSKDDAQRISVSQAAHKVYTWMAHEGLTGFGMPASMVRY